MKLRAVLKQLEKERLKEEQENARRRKEERKQKMIQEMEKARKKKAKQKEKNRRLQAIAEQKSQARKAEKARRRIELEVEMAKRKIEKQRLQEQRQRESLIEQEKQKKLSIEKLKREVLVSFDFKTAVPGLTAVMEKHGEIEVSRISPIGLHVRYTTLAAAKKAQKKKTLISKLHSTVSPAEIKHHAVYFEAPEEMGEIDQDVLSQVESAMGAYGKVVNIKKKARYIIIFFDNTESSNTLTSNEGNDVTIEFEGHTVALVAGVPPTQRKRRNAAREAKKHSMRIIQKNGRPTAMKQ